VVQVLWYRSS